MTQSLTRRDIDLYYNNTYVTYKGDPALIVGVAGSDSKPMVHLSVLSSKNVWGETIQTSFTDSELDLSYPTPGLINTPSGFVVLFKRLAAKQYKKALCPETSSIVDIFTEERAALSRKEFMGFNQTLSLRNKVLLRNIFNRKFFSVDDAINSVVGGDRCASAISPVFCIAAKKTNLHPVLMRKMKVIGHLIDGVVILQDNLFFFREEVQSQGFIVGN